MLRVPLISGDACQIKVRMFGASMNNSLYFMIAFFKYACELRLASCLADTPFYEYYMVKVLF